MLYGGPGIRNLPRNREEHRARVRARLIADLNGGPVDEHNVERVFRSELPRPTQEDFEELNAGLLGGDFAPTPAFAKGGGTALASSSDSWDRLRQTDDLEAAERRVLGGEIDESACESRRWDTDWWRLREARSAWISDEERASSEVGSEEDVDDDEEMEEPNDIEFQRSPTMFTGFPQKGAVYNPGSLGGLWTGRMLVRQLSYLLL